MVRHHATERKPLFLSLKNRWKCEENRKRVFWEISGNSENPGISGVLPPVNAPFFFDVSAQNRGFSGPENSGKFREISGKKMSENWRKSTFFFKNTGYVSLRHPFTWRENLTDDFFFFGKTKFHFFRNFKCVILSEKFPKKKRIQDFFAPMVPLLRRGGSVFLTFFPFKTPHLKWRQNRVGESVCSTFI